MGADVSSERNVQLSFSFDEEGAFDRSNLSRRKITQPTSEAALANGELASAKAMELLLLRTRGTAKIEQGSVYGAVLLLPQIARTAGWSLHYTALAVRSFFFLLMNYVAQGFLLYMISKDERINERYGGQMHLCNFGSGLPHCPDSSDCIGPTGTVYESDRIRSWHAYHSRLFVQEALIRMFPQREDEIKELVDPGEYGLESFWLRLSCIFLFVLGQWQEIVSIFDLAFLLWGVPSCPEPWMSYEKVERDRGSSVFSTDVSRRSSADAVSRRFSVRNLVGRRMSARKSVYDRFDNRKSVQGRRSSVSLHARRSSIHLDQPPSFEHDEFESVTIRIAGMPLYWKFVNVVCVVIPRVYLWILMLDIGHMFLVETASIEEMVMNAVSLFFILSIDELIYTALFGDAAHELVQRTESLQLWEIVGDLADDDGTLCRHQKLRTWRWFSGRLWWLVFPSRLFFLVAIILFFQATYYYKSCTRLQDGSVISKAIFKPRVPELPFLSFLFGPFEMFDVEVTPEPIWQFVNSST